MLKYKFKVIKKDKKEKRIKEKNKILIYVTHSSKIQKLADNTIEI